MSETTVTTNDDRAKRSRITALSFDVCNAARFGGEMTRAMVERYLADHGHDDPQADAQAVLDRAAQALEGNAGALLRLAEVAR